MPNSPDYKRGYANGYNARNRDAWAIEQRHMQEVKAVAERAERAEAASGVGHCENCQHWNRPQPTYAWGICRAPKMPGTPFGCWVQAEDLSNRQTMQISTSPLFGCVLFMSRTDGVTGTGGNDGR